MGTLHHMCPLASSWCPLPSNIPGRWLPHPIPIQWGYVDSEYMLFFLWQWCTILKNMNKNKNKNRLNKINGAEMSQGMSMSYPAKNDQILFRIEPTACVFWASKHRGIACSPGSLIHREWNFLFWSQLKFQVLWFWLMCCHALLLVMFWIAVYCTVWTSILFLNVHLSILCDVIQFLFPLFCYDVIISFPFSFSGFSSYIYIFCISYWIISDHQSSPFIGLKLSPHSEAAQLSSCTVHRLLFTYFLQVCT